MSFRQKKNKRPQARQLPFPNPLYSALQQQEAKLDYLLIRKRLDCQEALSKSIRQTQTLRVFVSHNSSYQYSGEDVPSWTLKIEGDFENPKKFSTFFKQVHVILERNENLYPEGNLVVWKKTAQSQESDGFEIKRAGDESLNIKILLYLDSGIEKYKISPQLAQLLNLHLETKPSILMAVWQYIKMNQLQDPHDHRTILCDEALKQVFGVPHFSFPQLPELLQPHLLSPDPIVFDYYLDVSQEYAMSPFALDIEVDLEDPVKQAMMKFVMNTSLQRDIAQLDHDIVKYIQKIHQHRLKKAFMLHFSKDPVEFIQKWIQSQASDLEIVLGDSQVNVEIQRRSAFYKEPWVHEALVHYLSSMASQPMMAVPQHQQQMPPPNFFQRK